MARKPRGGPARCVAAAILIVASVALFAPRAHAQLSADPLSPYELPKDKRIELFASLITNIDARISQASNEIELDAVARVLGVGRTEAIAAFQQKMQVALQDFLASKAALKTDEQRLARAKSALEAERAKMATPAVPPEETELDGVIAQVKGEIAELDGRVQRVAAAEAKLKAMPVAGFMSSAPREAAEQELAQARANLPKPGELEKARKDLAGYEAQLKALRAKRPTPPAVDLPARQREVDAANTAIAADIRGAEQAKKEFMRLRAQALGFTELFEWLESLVNNRRQALRAATGVPAQLAQCASTQGPFRCTGVFDGTWSARCEANARDFRGPAKATFGADGWVEVTMTDLNARANENPIIVGGKIAADGTLLVERPQKGAKETYRGKFSLGVSPSGKPRPVGGGTYELAVFDDKGAVVSRCSGSMNLN